MAGDGSALIRVVFQEDLSRSHGRRRGKSPGGSRLQESEQHEAWTQRGWRESKLGTEAGDAETQRASQSRC